jgi:hypothetical protein
MTPQRKAKLFYIAYCAVVSTAIALVIGGLVSLFSDDLGILVFGIVFGYLFADLLERGAKKLPW